MKIIARIDKLGPNQYMFAGQSFDSFLQARQEMTALMKRRRLQRRATRLRAECQPEAMTAL